MHVASGHPELWPRSSLFLDESPHVGQLLERISTSEVVVVPLFVADGYHTTTDIPQAIGHPGVGEAVELDGRLVHLTGAVGTEPRVADVIVERAVEAGASIDRDSSTGLTQPARAFLATLEAPFEWGELVIDRSESGFSVRHREERGVNELTPLADAGALRQHVRHDDNGQYRPLSGAESLPTGWVLAGLSGQELVSSVRAVYPGSIALWHRDRTGRLEPTSFDKTAARQSGIYAEVDALDANEREAAIESVCGSCVRERRWSSHETDTPDCSGDVTAIPCREACPFLLSATHAVADLERAEEPTIVDTEVAPGALAEPGNRYRVRYTQTRSAQRGEF
ncbi:MAG: DR2241 family protein [Natrialbaceae archaeon]|nr:DR2241 family protein [Natrialbaceae archaeon]